MITRLLISLLCLTLFVAPAWAVTITDDFNCTNNASLTCDLTWTEFSGTGYEIANNKAGAIGTGGNTGARAETTLTGVNQSVQTKLTGYTYGTGSNAIGPICRKDSSTTTEFYAMRAVDVGGTAGTRFFDLIKYGAGFSETNLDTDTQDPAINDVMKMTCQNSGGAVVIKGYVNGIEILSATDSSSPYTGAGYTYAGLHNYRDSDSSNDFTLDDFEAIDIASLDSENKGCYLKENGVDFYLKENASDRYALEGGCGTGFPFADPFDYIYHLLVR